MSDRICISSDGGGIKFRVAKPGKSYLSSNLDDFNIHESHKIYRGIMKGVVSFAGSGSQDVPIYGITGPFFVSIQSRDGAMPCYMGAYAQSARASMTGTADLNFNTYYAVLFNQNLLRIVNVHSVPRVIDYCVFGNRIDGHTAT